MSWAQSSALTPTPFNRSDDVVRVYAGFRDHSGVSRIGYVDLEAANPSKVIGYSREPVLDIGRAGCFDDNGVILGDVVRNGAVVQMYYAGFQLVAKAKFLAFTGLAQSHDNGESFVRLSQAPVIDRSSGANFIGALHSIRKTSSGWRAWIARGDGWETRAGVPYPRYDIWQIDSKDGIGFHEAPRNLISVSGDEYRIGRPSVFERPDGSFGMFYTAGCRSSDAYAAGYAHSLDGETWVRQDDDVGMTIGHGSDFDSRHLCYPRLFQAGSDNWAVYNGNDMGVEGFGLARLVEW